MSLPPDILQQLIQDIQKTYPSSIKKEILPIIEKFTLKNQAFQKLIEEKPVKDISRTRIYRDILKKIKRQLYYQRRTFTRKSDEPCLDIVEQICKESSLSSRRSIELHENLLQSHVSTQERIPHYLGLYQKIFTIVGYPDSILDLGCGINFFSIPFLIQATGDCPKKLLYTGIEKKKDEADLGKRYLRCVSSYLDPNSSIIQKDILQLIREEQPLVFEKVYDLCFLFRMIPLLERHRKKTTILLLSKIQAKRFVVSISLKSLVKEEDISVKQRTLLEKILNQTHLKIITRFTMAQEEFYILE